MRGAGNGSLHRPRCGTRWLDLQGTYQVFFLSTFSIDTQLVSLTGCDATQTSKYFSTFIMNLRNSSMFLPYGAYSRIFLLRGRRQA